MSTKIEDEMNSEYKWGFETKIEVEEFPKGLSEEIVRLISAKNNEPEWMLEFRLKAYRQWLKMTHPEWSYFDIPKIDFQALYYYAKPKSDSVKPASLDDLYPELLATFEK
jgi:Fe-S cluster assembly protein SufB